MGLQGFYVRFITSTILEGCCTQVMQSQPIRQNSLAEREIMSSQADQRMESTAMYTMPVVPLRTLSKGTLDMIAADVKRGMLNSPGAGTQLKNEQGNVDSNVMSGFEHNMDLNQQRSFEKSLSSLSQLSAAHLSRNNSIDVPAAIAAAQRVAASADSKSGDNINSNPEHNAAIARRNTFLSLQANYAAKAEELKRSQDEHLELTMAHMELQKKAELLAKQMDESQLAVKNAQEQARHADFLWKSMFDKNTSEMTMLPMEEVQRVFDQNDSVPMVPASNESDTLTPTRSMSFRRQAGSGDMSLFERTRSFQSSLAIDEEIKRFQSRFAACQARIPSADVTNATINGSKANTSKVSQDVKLTGVKRPAPATSSLVQKDCNNAKISGTAQAPPARLPTKPVIIHAVPQDASKKPRLECRNCGRVNTPQWRIGPDGPKTLCNACGVHYRKFKSLPLFQIKFQQPDQ